MIQEIKKAVYHLNNDGVVIFPTETVFALACKLSSAKAIEKIYQIKKRDADKPLSVLFQDFLQLKDYVNTDGREGCFEKYTPGPITFVLPCKKNKMLDCLRVKNNSLGVRIPDHKISQDILKKVGEPIVATSVNLSGEQPAVSIETIDPKVAKVVDFILEGNKSKFSKPSTVVDLTSGSPTILRQGSLIFVP